jgi:hypothetical protein
MTLNSALQLLRTKTHAAASEELVFLEETLQTVSSRKRHAKESSSHLRAGGSSIPTGVVKAKEMLNAMIEETQMKYDMELQHCCEYDETQSKLIEKARQSISVYNALAAEARKDALEATRMIQTSKHNLAKLHDAFETQSAECNTEIVNNRAQLETEMAELERYAANHQTSPNLQTDGEDKLAYAEADSEDKRDELQGEMAKEGNDCESMSHNLKAQMSDFAIKLKDSGVSLAIGTKNQHISEGQSRLKQAELRALQQHYAKMTETCHTNYATLEAEECGVKKIRAELYQMQGQGNPASFQDCVVAEWRPHECSASCEGGLMKLERTIVTNSIGGAKCPALVAMKPCNEDKCPVDCRLHDWEGWSACSAKCGGGIRERTRHVEVEPMHRGTPCEETSEAGACSMQACDRDCVLTTWTDWTSCSKECDTGITERRRGISVLAVGDGTCPADESVERYDHKVCNAVACVKTNPSPTLQCESRLDVILVIDGSGSLGQSGWAASVKGGAMLARAFGGSKAQVQLAVLLFSAKPTWLQHFSSDIEAGAVSIENAAWPKSITRTADALNAARSELNLGRGDAQSVVIVITDGRPLSPRKTSIVVESLRRQARLIWVPVTKFAFDAKTNATDFKNPDLARMKDWASYPKKDNFLPLASFQELEDPATMNDIIADVCPQVD